MPDLEIITIITWYGMSLNYFPALLLHQNKPKIPTSVKETTNKQEATKGGPGPRGKN